MYLPMQFETGKIFLVLHLTDLLHIKQCLLLRKDIIYEVNIDIRNKKASSRELQTVIMKP